MLPHMSLRDRLWKVDDWFRPVAPDGTMRSRRRAVTPRDRLWMLLFLIVASLVVGALFLQLDAGRAMAMSSSFIGAAAVQLVNLYRTRSIGFSGRR